MAIVVVGAMSMSAGAQQGQAVLQQAARAMGATTLQSIQYAGDGSTFVVGQQGMPSAPWPRFNTKYAVEIDYRTLAMRREIVRSQALSPPSGGAGQPLVGEQRQVQVLSGAPVWLTPHGLIKAALASNAHVKGNVITFTLDGHSVTATLNPQHLVERFTYATDDPVLGDTLIETTYSAYAAFGSIQFPTRIVETQGGFPTLDIMVRDVTPNAAVTVAVPPAATAEPSALTVNVQKITSGVWMLTAAGYNTIAVEFSGHLVMVEAPLGDARTVAVNAAIRQAVPGKPIRYVVNTHHHFDHIGGLRAYVAEGIPIITHELNKPYYERLWARPRTLKPDMLAKSPRPAVFETMTDKKVLSDGSRTLELHHIQGSGHAAGMIVGYLPKEHVMIEADLFNPPEDGGRDPSLGPDYQHNFHENLQRLELDMALLVPIHGPAVMIRHCAFEVNFESGWSVSRRLSKGFSFVCVPGNKS